MRRGLKANGRVMIDSKVEPFFEGETTGDRSWGEGTSLQMHQGL